MYSVYSKYTVGGEKPRGTKAEMFSPTRPPLLESSSEGEEDLDLPTVEIGTPQKRPKTEIEDERLQATKSPPAAASSSSSGASNKPCRVTSPPATASTSAAITSSVSRSPSQSNTVKFEGEPNACKDSAKATTRRNTFPSIADELKNLSPLKTDSYRETKESKRTAMKVRKLTKSLKEKTDMDRKVGPWSVALVSNSSGTAQNWTLLGQPDYSRIS